jgi:hypothetical protein
LLIYAEPLFAEAVLITATRKTRKLECGQLNMHPNQGEIWWFRLDGRDWIVGSGGGVCTDGRSDPLGVRAEAAYAHCSYRIEQCAVPFDRIDAILALKRSLRARLEHLDSALSLSTIPVAGIADPNDWLGKLEGLGIIKKGMLRRLNRLRNAIEHDGAEPPAMEQCKDYHEMMWYFLKVTTPYLRPPTDEELMSADDDDPSSLACDINYRPFALGIRGTLAENCLSRAKEKDWLRVSVTEVRDHYIANQEYLWITATVDDFDSQATLLRCLFDKFI